MQINKKCLYCGSHMNEFFRPYNRCSVTSDGKPFFRSEKVYHCSGCGILQKAPTYSYQENIAEIYKAYSSQFLVDGSDAVIDSQDRSDFIIENVSEYLPQEGSVMDIGTGSGVFLKSLINKTNLDCYAQDLNANHKSSLERLGLKGVYFSDLASISEKFDVVTAIHVIEHVIDGREFYCAVKRRLKSGGIFIAQVPLVSQNEFDLLVYDHVLHFTRDSIVRMLSKFFTYVVFPKQTFKEITVVASDKKITGLSEDNSDIKSLLPNVNRVNELIKKTLKLGDVYIFGSGPPSIYMANVLSEKVVSFIDEDKRKLGKTFMGKRFQSSCDAEKNYPVVIPFPVKQAKEIAKRLEGFDVAY